MLSTNEMKIHLNSMYYEGTFDFQLPKTNNQREAICIFNKNLPTIAWNILSAFEENPATLPQTETILKGQSVSGISIDELEQVKNYGDGAKKMLAMLREESFELSQDVACQIHYYVAKEEAFSWGVFRDKDVLIRGVSYSPPDAFNLPAIATTGFNFLNEKIADPIERGFAAFLFMARNQFFHDGNKRTATLMMNGIFLKNLSYPVTIHNRDSQEFHTKLSDFYNSGNATDMMKFFENMSQKMYSSFSSDEHQELGKIYIDVPRSVHDIAKELEAKWDKDEKSWYIMSDNPKKEELLEIIKVGKAEQKKKEQESNHAECGVKEGNVSSTESKIQSTFVNKPRFGV